MVTGPAVTPALTRAVRWGLVLLLWTPLVVSASTIFPYVVGKALAARLVIAALAVLWVPLLVLDPASRPRRSFILGSLGAYMLVQAVATVLGNDPTHSLWSDYQRMTGFWDLAHWVVLVVVASSVLRESAHWRWFLTCNVLVAMTLAVMGMLQAYTSIAWLPDVLSDGRVTATLGNASYLAGVLVVALFHATGLLASWWRVREPRRTWLPGLAVGVALLALYLTGTRGALVGLIAGVGALVWCGARTGDRATARATRFVAVGMLVVFAVLALVDGMPGQSLNPRVPSATLRARAIGTSQSDLERLELARIGFAAWLDRPLIGWGPAGFRDAFDRHAPASYYRYTSDGMDQAHNKVIEEAVTGGLFGLVSYLVVWIAFLRAAARRSGGAADEALGAGMTAAAVALFGQGLFLFDTSVLSMQWAILLAWGVFREASGNAHPQVSPRASDSRLPWAALVGVVGLGALSFITSTTILPPYRAARAARSALPPGGDLADRVRLAESSFAAFPRMAPMLQRYMLTVLTVEWASRSFAEREVIIAFVEREGEAAVAAHPRDARLLAAALPILQVLARSPEERARVDSLVARLATLAPQRVTTHQILAAQALEAGDPGRALAIAEAFEHQAPGVASAFAVLRQEVSRRSPGRIPPR